MKRALIPVAWVEIGKRNVSYHLMGMHGNAKLRAGMSRKLSARMRGKTCFRLSSDDKALFAELEQVTALGLAGIKRAGFVSEVDWKR